MVSYKLFNYPRSLSNFIAVDSKDMDTSKGNHKSINFCYLFTLTLETGCLQTKYDFCLQKVKILNY